MSVLRRCQAVLRAASDLDSAVPGTAIELSGLISFCQEYCQENQKQARSSIRKIPQREKPPNYEG